MKGCEACELHRTGRFTVRLSGQLYHCETLQEDTFMPDDSQVVFHANPKIEVLLKEKFERLILTAMSVCRVSLWALSVPVVQRSTMP